MKKRSEFKQWLLLIVAVATVAFVLFWPLPKYIEGPGEASAINQFVKIKNHPDKYSGYFMLTSVGITQARPVTYLLAKFFPYYTIENPEAVTSGQNMTEYEKVQDFYMRSSISQATYTAYKAAHQQVKLIDNGIYVLQVQPQSKFKDKLKVGDVVTEIYGHPFKRSDNFVKYIQGKKKNDQVEVTYLRNGKRHQVTAPLMQIDKHRAGIGITLTDNMTVKTEISIKVNPGDVGGPSGGLMFSLQIYSQLIKQDIRHGKKIAGTGTINDNGQVGEIGGIDKKIIAAKKSGATIFLAPYVKPTKTVLRYEPDHITNYQLAKQTAKKYAPNLKVVPISDFNQAIKYLQNQKD